MRRLINGVIWLLGLFLVLTVYFFVPVGRFTLYEHTLRISATEPAQELGDDLLRTGSDLSERALDEWDDRAAIRDASDEVAPDATSATAKR